MGLEDNFKKRLSRMEKWADRSAQVWNRFLSRTEEQYLNLLRDIEEEKSKKEIELKACEEKLKAEYSRVKDQVVKTKYKLEKDTASASTEIKNLQEENERLMVHLESELERAKRELFSMQLSYDRQKSALEDLYQEKKRHVLVQRDKFIREAAQAKTHYQAAREKFGQETTELEAVYKSRIQSLNDELISKRQGWELSLETMKRDYESLNQQKQDLLSRLSSVRNEKENELKSIKMQMQIEKEKLELDKVALVEKAESEQKDLEKSVQDLDKEMTSNEEALQNLIMNKEAEKKNLEDQFLHEEEAIKVQLKSESDKRDYDQKLYIQEKEGKEKELNSLRDEYERKKSQWDNQIRTLMMQKSVQDAEFDAERMRTDREVRIVLRGLESKRDELKRRLSEIKNRCETISANAAKEMTLISQRWQWRKDRIWTMWQNRLQALKQERLAINEKLVKLQEDFMRERAGTFEEKERAEGQIDSLQQQLSQKMDHIKGLRSQREIQFELEKTRVIAQIRECEVLIEEWNDRQKKVVEELSNQKLNFTNQINFLDQFSKSEQHETDLFLHSLKTTLGVLESKLQVLEEHKKAA